MNLTHIKKIVREYAFSGRDNYSRERWCVDFEDLIVIMFNEKILMIYKS